MWIYFTDKFNLYLSSFFEKFFNSYKQYLHRRRFISTVRALFVTAVIYKQISEMEVRNSQSCLYLWFRQSLTGGTRTLPCSSTPQATEAEITPDVRSIASVGL